MPGCCCTPPNLCPAPGDSENNLLAKILTSLNNGGGGSGGGVTGLSVDGGPFQTGQVSIITSGPSSLLNFTDENGNADGVMWGNAGTTEILRSVGATGNLQATAARIHRNVDNSQLAILGGIGKTTGAFFEVNGDTAASVGFAGITTKGRAAGTGTFRILNAPLASLASTVRAQMTWEGDWQLTPIWNDVADAFVAFDVNPTNTLSAAGALLGRFRASSVSQWEVSKTGATTQLGSGTMTQLRLPNTSSATVGGIYFNALRFVHNFGTSNTFVGANAGNLTMTGATNVALGTSALFGTTSGSDNMAIGAASLTSNSSGAGNVGVGTFTLLNNTTGSSNVAIGTGAMQNNVSGANNVGIGVNSLFTNTASGNVAIGVSTLFGNSSGQNQVAVGLSALVANTTGSNNTAVGYLALSANTTGGNNTVFGFMAGDNLTTGLNNIVLGYDIDSPTATNSNTLTIGNLIFGTGLTSTGTTVSTGSIGIGVINPATKFQVVGTSTLDNITQTTAALFSVTSGANTRAGNATLVAGTVTVGNTTITANSILLYSRKTSGGTIGTAMSYTLSAGTSFTLTSDSALDTSTFSYWILENP